MNTTDFLFLIRKALPNSRQPDPVSAGGQNAEHESDEQEEQSDEMDGVNDGNNQELESVLIKRKYIDVEDYKLPADEILPEQLMLSSAGCSSLYALVDGVMEEADEVETDEAENVVMTEVLVSVNQDSWSQCCAHHEGSGGGGRTGGDGANSESHNNSSGKRRLSKAEKKRLQKQGTSNSTTVSEHSSDGTAEIDSFVAPAPDGINLVLNYEAMLTMNKKGTKYTGYNLKVDVISPEEICRSVSDVVQTYLK